MSSLSSALGDQIIWNPIKEGKWFFNLSSFKLVLEKKKPIFTEQLSVPDKILESATHQQMQLMAVCFYVLYLSTDNQAELVVWKC